GVAVAVAISGERIDTGGGAEVRVTRALEGVRERLSNPLGSDTPLPPLETASHPIRVRPSCRTRYEFHRKCLRALPDSLVRGAHLPCSWPSMAVEMGRILLEPWDLLCRLGGRQRDPHLGQV